MVLGKNDSPDNWKEVTSAERTAIEKADEAWRRPPQSFIDEWNAIPCCSYNELTGFFEASLVMDNKIDYGIKDIPYADAVDMVNRRGAGGDWSGLCQNVRRINLPPVNYANPQLNSFGLVCAYAYEMEVLWLGESGRSYIPGRVLGGVYNCPKLRVIAGYLNSNTSTTSANLPLLEEVRVNMLTSGISVSFPNSPLLSLASVRYTADNSAGKTTFVVHPDVYAKLNDPTDTEWHKVKTDGEARGVMFQSA